MKTNVKFLALAVVATALAFSCVKEEIAEENINDNQDKTEVEITGQVFEAVMENTKSTLVDKTPTWAEEDVIALFGNGSESAVQLTYAGENKFQTAAGVTVEGPYYAIYPYDENHTVDQTTGIFTATVPAEQTIAQGQNVAAGALASVAYSEGTQLYFRNAVGLVRLENKREDIVSIKIESTNAEQMLAGSFTMDLNPDKDAENEAPVVTPATEGGSASITLKPAEENGTFASGELYAAVLPGAIDGIKVTFTRKNGEETETAIVTKQKAVTIERNGGANLGSFFTYEISNANELLAWNKAYAKWTDWDVVTLTNDIDCKDIIDSEDWTWTPNEFTGTFDGNDKTIDNFVIELAGPAAFFGRTNGSAVVKDLTFGEGCSFTTTASTPVSDDDFYANNRMYAAAVVCEAKDKSTFSNIKNYGSVTATGTGAGNGNYIAGVVASYESSNNIAGCVNHGGITYSGTPKSWTNVGGCFGQVTLVVQLNGCENHGFVQFDGTNSSNSRLNLGGIVGGIGNITSFNECKNLGKVECNATAKHSGNVHIGGLIGYVDKNILGTMTACSNGSDTDAAKGALSNNAECGLNNAGTNVVTIGGCVGFINGKNASISNFQNYGAISNTKPSSAPIALGGIVGEIYNATDNSISSCENHGTITNTGTLMTAYMGGMVGWLNNANTSLDKVSNGGAVTNNGAVTNTLESEATTYIRLGGIVGYAQGGTGHAITNATNTVTIKNTKGGNAADIGNSIADLGGIVGKIDQSDLTIGNDVAEGVKNSGAILNEGQSTDNGLGGIVGSITAAANTNTIKNCLNSGKIYRNGWANNKINGHGFGGIVGYHFATGAATLTINTCKNTGSVEKLGGAASDHHIGGIVGSLLTTSVTATISDCVNTGNVTYANGSDWANNRYCYTAGVVGHFNSKGEIVRCSNSGTITNKFATSAATGIRVGGIVGNTMTATITDCTNSGAVKDESTGNGGYIGGIVGWIHTNKGNLTNCDNTGTISATFNSETRSSKQNRQHAYIGGIVGGSNVEVVLVNCDNNADIINKSPKSNTGAKTAIAGIAGFCNSNVTMTTCTTSGNITNNGTDTLNEYIGGLAGQIENNKTTKITGCTVTANLAVKVTKRDANHFSGILVGRLTDKVDGSGADATVSTTIQNVTVKGGSYNGTALTAENLGTYTFGHASNYGGKFYTKGGSYATTGITYAE